MKKILISIVAVALAALMIANAYALSAPPLPICGRCPGFTPGFWKHNIQVRLSLTNGAYNAFEGGPLDGVKLTDALMNGYLAAINGQVTPDVTFQELLGYLEGPGWSTDRTNSANWFNWAAGYNPY